MSARAMVLAVWLGGCATVTPATTNSPEQATVRGPEPVVHWAPTAIPEALAPVVRSRPTPVTRALKNGLKVVVVEDHRARLVKLRLFFSSGSSAESDQTAGSTAFALQVLGDRFDEHDESGELVSYTEKSARMLALAKGATLSFDVTPDVSSVGLDGYARDASALVKMLDGLVRNPRQGRESFQGRRQAAVDLINELELTDGLALEQFLLQLAFGTDHPYSRSQFGTAASLELLGVEQVIARQNELLTPRGSTLLVVGDVSAEKTLALVERTFGSWSGEQVERVRVEPARVTRRRNVVFLPRKPSRNTLVCLTRPLVDLKAIPRPASQLAVAVAGQARIAQVLREKFGLTYSVSSTVIERRAASAMAVCSRVRSDDAIQATRLMLEAFVSLGTEPPTRQEVERARAQAVTQLELAQDEPEGVAAAWQAAIGLGKAAPPTDDVTAMKAVTLEQVAAAAKALSNRDVLQVILSGEKAMAEATARANALGGLQTPRLRKVEGEASLVLPDPSE